MGFRYRAGYNLFTGQVRAGGKKGSGGNPSCTHSKSISLPLRSSVPNFYLEYLIDINWYDESYVIRILEYLLLDFVYLY